MSLTDLGYIRIAACAPVVSLADPMANAERLLHEYHQLSADGASLVLFPELALSGYSCEDLFFSHDLHADCRRALGLLAHETTGQPTVLVVGAPWLTTSGRLLNCAFVCAGGAVRGAVPKLAQPNHGEFYDLRWFVSGTGMDEEVDDPRLGAFRIAAGQLFSLGQARFGIEICEDLWSPVPPGAALALAGADLIVNPSASNELVAKADYRRDLVRMASAQRICAYLYASSGPTESSKDVVFGGHLLAAENGHLLGESERFSLAGSRLLTEFDWQRLRHDRARNITYASAERVRGMVLVDTGVTPTPMSELQRTYPRRPFVPDDEAEFDARAREILSIQSTGLARRLLAANCHHLVLGLSGGLDSTLAFLVCRDALEQIGRPPSALVALTMPGPGTSQRTLQSVRALVAATGVPLKEIPIDAALAQHLRDLEHPLEQHDTVFENAQARERTQLLFNYANKVGGIVVGTGDLSELALGWCTFNGDHMANYNVNASVPKTMIAYLVRWYARHRSNEALARVLEQVLDTPISPELLPPDASGQSQSTEAAIGPYELHDYFLFHYLRNGFGPEKIFRLARQSFADEYDAATLLQWMKVFFTRFFSQQFKRTTLPPGPKVGTVSLSPRGDWRMPDEAGAASILGRIDDLEE
jgi:NAD+ synthase (glutamine-hydrolysing)